MSKNYLGIIVSVLFLLPINVYSSETIVGQYCYTYGDRETIQESRELVRTLSIRNGIESYRVFIESSTKVKNFTLSNDLVQMISSGYLKNIKVLEHTEEGRTICEKISGTVEPKEIEKVIENQISVRTKKIEDMGLDNNGYVKILSVSDYKTKKDGYYGSYTDTTITVKLKTIKNFHYEDPHCYIFVTEYDSNGNEISTKRDEKCCTILDMYSSKMIYSGEIKTCYLTHIGGDSYKVWLLDGIQNTSNNNSKTDKTIDNKNKKTKKFKN